ncbi:MAG: efflux RND transporter periplasmic adaptor subunit [Bacteroidales bacterium]|nr:efflux RND transporter periplasmic adaptor subunit [Bacteroidales bacterium]
MSTKILYYGIAITVLSCIVSCTSRGGSRRDNKAEYAPEINQVEVVALEKTDFSRQLVSNGKLSAAGRASLYFTTSGVIAKIAVENGARVQKGALLGKIEDREVVLNLESATLSLKKAELELFDFLAKLGYKAGDTLSMEKSVLDMAKMRSGYSETKNSYERARIALDGASVVAPFAGKIADLKAKRFDKTNSDAFCTIIDDSSFDVDFTVMESEYSFLAKGLTVKVLPFADLTRTIEGKITSINPSVDSKGQIMVRARIPNDGTLIDGMNVKVMVERTIPGQLVVPKSAVVVRDYMDVLFTYTDDGKAHWIYVNILNSNSTSHAVAANETRGAVLNEGDRVIVSGNLNLADGSSVVLK